MADEVPAGEDAQESEEPVKDEQPVEELTSSQEENLVTDEQSEEAMGVATQSEEVIPASDVTAQVKNLDWALYRATDDSEPAKDLGSDPSAYTDALGGAIVRARLLYAEVKFDVDAPGGGFSENDTITLPFLNEAGFSGNEAKSQDFKAEDGEVIGTWMIGGGAYDAKIVITLNSKASAHTSLTNCKIVTAKTLSPNRLYGEKDTVKTLSIGGVSHDYAYKALNKYPIQPVEFKKSFDSGSNGTLLWTLGYGTKFVNELTTSSGLSMSNITSDVIFEDEFSAADGVTRVSAVSPYCYVPFIMPDDQHAAVLGGLSLLSTYVSAFSQVTQNDGETYETFKARLGTLQYGIFETEEGNFKVVINCGNPCDSSYPLKYTDLWPDMKTSIMNSGYDVPESEADVIVKSLITDSCVNGNVVSLSFYIQAEYNTVLIDTDKYNSAKATFETDGISAEYKAENIKGTLKSGSAIATPAKESATIAKADSVSGLGLGGVTFKLQSSTTETGTYSDTTYGPNSDGTFVTSSADDNTKGTVNTGTLSPGWYKFVEVSGLDGYVGTYTSDPFQITGGGEGVVVVATNTPIDYTVHYDTNGATSAAIADKTNVKYWDADLLPFVEPTKAGYKFDGWKLSKRADTALSADDIKNGSAVADTAKYQDLALADTVAHITLQAQWSPKTAATLAPEVSKTVTGTLPATEAFTFNIALDPGTQTNVTMPTDTTATTSAIATGDTTATFDSISFSQAGTYTFKVTEAAGTTNNLSYDNSEIIMTVVVTENDTALVAGTPTFSKAGEDSTLAFTNAYAPDPVDAAALDIEKVLTGDTPDVDETFNFELAASDASNPLPTETTLSITGAGTDAFDTWTYTAAGTYTYEVTEQAGTNTAYTYDSTVYTVTDTVTDTAGVLSVDREISNGTNTVAGILFTNIYTAPTTTDPDPDPEPVPVPEKPIISVVKSADKNTVAPEETIVYTLTITNSGKGVADAVRVRDYIPTLTTFVSASDDGVYVDGESPYVEWVVSNVAAGATVTLHLEVSVVSGAKDKANIENTALFDDNSDNGEPTPTNTTETTVDNPSTATDPGDPTPINSKKSSSSPASSTPKTADSTLLLVEALCVLIATSALILVMRHRRNN